MARTRGNTFIPSVWHKYDSPPAHHPTLVLALSPLLSCLWSSPSHCIINAQIFASGAVVGVAAAVLLSPVEMIKIRLQVLKDIPLEGSFTNGTQVQTESKQRLYTGPIDCIIKTVKRDGVLGLGRGLTATWLRDIPAFAFYFWVYEGLRRYAGPFSTLTLISNPH